MRYFLYCSSKFNFKNVCLENEHFLNPAVVYFLKEGEVVEVSLLLLRLLGENVAMVSVLSLDFARAGKREALFGTGDRL